MPFPPQFTLQDKRGDTNDYAFTILEEGNPVDLTAVGTQVWCTGKLSANDPDNQAVWQKTLGNGIAITGPGAAIATVQPADTGNLPDATIVNVDVQIKYPSGRIQTSSEGTITYYIDITRTTA